MQLHSLYLAPVSPADLPAIDRVLATLREQGVIGAALGDRTYRTGDGFAQRIVFAGCSPHLVTEPPTDGSAAFCHVVVHGPYESIRLVTATGLARPRCPACRQRVDADAAPRDAGAVWRCPACQRVATACELDWRQYGLCGRLLVEIVNVFPGEATPSDGLMLALQRATNLRWRFAWGRYSGRVIEADQATTT